MWYPPQKTKVNCARLVACLGYIILDLKHATLPSCCNSIILSIISTLILMQNGNLQHLHEYCVSPHSYNNNCIHLQKGIDFKLAFNSISKQTADPDLAIHLHNTILLLQSILELPVSSFDPQAISSSPDCHIWDSYGWYFSSRTWWNQDPLVDVDGNKVTPRESEGWIGTADFLHWRSRFVSSHTRALLGSIEWWKTNTSHSCVKLWQSVCGWEETACELKKLTQQLKYRLER